MGTVSVPAPPTDEGQASRSQDVTEGYLGAAIPGQGTVTYADGYRTDTHQAEIHMAWWLHERFGGDILLLKESTIEGEKRADYLWRGRLWDLKNVSTEKAANTALKRGLSQIRPNPGGIILNYSETEINIEVLIEVIDKRMQWLKEGFSVDIMIVLNDGAVKVLRYHRKGRGTTPT